MDTNDKVKCDDTNEAYLQSMLKHHLEQSNKLKQAIVDRQRAEGAIYYLTKEINDCLKFRYEK